MSNQNRLLIIGALVLFLFFFWLVWGMLNKQPDLTQGKTQAPVVSTPPAPTAPDGFVLVKGGTFQLGSPTNEKGRESDEAQHAVTVSGFYMGKYEVTQAEWIKTMSSNPSYFKNCDQCPVENVSWEDVQEYLKKLNAQTGKKYRLPTEAEWEYAAREGGKNVRFGNGKDIADPAEMNFDAKNYGDYEYAKKGSYRAKTTPVGSFQPNALGLYDMSGNVWEWCGDWYRDYSSGAQTDPKGADSGDYRVRRGGGWLTYPRRCRAADRGGNGPSFRNDGLGFRLVLQ